MPTYMTLIQYTQQGVENMNSLQSWTAEQFDPKLSWDDIEWIKKRWGGPLILKGILDVEDAKRSIDTGADAIIVSNHGTGQLTMNIRCDILHLVNIIT